MHLLNLVLRVLCDNCANFIAPKTSGVETHDTVTDEGIGIRVYKPVNIKPARPIVLYCHGGGWVLGSIKSYDPILRYISLHGDCTVVGIGYRKAPKYKFPTAIDDAYIGYKWAIANISEIKSDYSNLILCGDSAGGGLALNLLQILRNKGEFLPIKLILIYPLLVTKISTHRESDKRKIIYRTSELILQYFLKQYLSSEDEKESPHLSLLENFEANQAYPETLFILGKLDVLNHGIKNYAKKLKAAGVDVSIKEYEKQMHGFINFAGFSKEGMRALDDIAKYIRDDLFL